MDEIELRAWDIESSVMMDWEEIQEMWESEGYSSGILRGDHWVPMLYIGRKDKNGKKIHAGDVVKVIDNEKSNRLANSPRYNIEKKAVDFEVRWHEPWMGFYFFTGKEIHMDIATLPENLEIIGNIYENPELIEKETEHE